MFTSEFNERSRSNPLCDFRLGTVATSDHETPLTVEEEMETTAGKVGNETRRPAEEQERRVERRPRGAGGGEPTTRWKKRKMGKWRYHWLSAQTK